MRSVSQNTGSPNLLGSTEFLSLSRGTLPAWPFPLVTQACLPLLFHARVPRHLTSCERSIRGMSDELFWHISTAEQVCERRKAEES